MAAAVGGRVVGDPGLRLSGVRSLDEAGPEDLSWVAGERRGAKARSSRAGAVLTASTEVAAGKPAVVVDSPALALARWLELRLPAARHRPGAARGSRVHPTARIGRGASVAPGATVAAGARIGDRTRISEGSFVGEGAEIGDDCLLHPNVVVREDCVVGSRCVLHAGVVVGSDGFGYVWDGKAHRKIPQVGIVRIGDDVEIGANSAIDRASLGETRIGRGTKIDNLVQVGHNVSIGRHCIIVAQTGISGSATLEDFVVLGARVGLNNHVTIGEGAQIAAVSVVKDDVPPGARWGGIPAKPVQVWFREVLLLERLAAQRYARGEDVGGRPPGLNERNKDKNA